MRCAALRGLTFLHIGFATRARWDRLADEPSENHHRHDVGQGTQKLALNLHADDVLDQVGPEFECLEEACVPVWSDQATMVDLASSVECKEGPPRQSSVTVTGTESRCVNRTANQCSFAGARIQTSRQCTEGSPDEVTLTTELPCQLAVEDRPLGDTCRASECRFWILSRRCVGGGARGCLNRGTYGPTPIKSTSWAPQLFQEVCGEFGV